MRLAHVSNYLHSSCSVKPTVHISQTHHTTFILHSVCVCVCVCAYKCTWEHDMMYDVFGTRSHNLLSMASPESQKVALRAPCDN